MANKQYQDDWKPPFRDSPMVNDISIDDFVHAYGLSISDEKGRNWYKLEPSSVAGGHSSVTVYQGRGGKWFWDRKSRNGIGGFDAVSFARAVIFDDYEKSDVSAGKEAFALLAKMYPQVYQKHRAWYGDEMRKHNEWIAKHPDQASQYNGRMVSSVFNYSKYQQVLEGMRDPKSLPDIKPIAYNFNFKEDLARFKAPLSQDPKTAANFMINVRGIDKNVIHDLMDSKSNASHKSFIVSTQRDALIFPWYDALSDPSKLQKPVGASLQGTVIDSRFDAKRKSEKRILNNSKTPNGFVFDSKEGLPEHLIVCEAPIDAISYYDALKRTNSLPSGNVRFVSLDGLKPTTLLEHLKANPQLKSIKLGVDLDAAGSDFIKKMQRQQKDALTTYASLDEKQRQFYLEHFKDDAALINAPKIMDSRIPNSLAKTYEIKDYNDLIKTDNKANRTLLPKHGGTWQKFESESTLKQNLTKEPYQVFTSSNKNQQKILQKTAEFYQFVARDTVLGSLIREQLPDVNDIGFHPDKNLHTEWAKENNQPAPKNPNSALYQVLSKDFSDDELKASRLFYQAKDGAWLSKLDNQVIIPNIDRKDQVISLATYKVDDFANKETGINVTKDLENAVERDKKLGPVINKPKKVKKLTNAQMRRKLHNDVQNQIYNQTKTGLDSVELLLKMADIDNLSSSNSLLVKSAIPNAEAVASYDDFQKLGYHINKGEHGVQILKPASFKVFKRNDKWVALNQANAEEKQAIKSGKLKTWDKHYFKAATVFDISQTDMPLNEKEKLTNSDPNFKLTNKTDLANVNDLIRSLGDKQKLSMQDDHDLKTLTTNVQTLMGKTFENPKLDPVTSIGFNSSTKFPVDKLQVDLASMVYLQKLGVKIDKKQMAKMFDDNDFEHIPQQIQFRILNNVSTVSKALKKRTDHSLTISDDKQKVVETKPKMPNKDAKIADKQVTKTVEDKQTNVEAPIKSNNKEVVNTSETNDTKQSVSNDAVKHDIKKQVPIKTPEIKNDTKVPPVADKDNSDAKLKVTDVKKVNKDVEKHNKDVTQPAKDPQNETKQVPENAVSDFDERNMSPLPPIPDFADSDIPPDPNNIDQGEKVPSNNDITQPAKDHQNETKQVSENVASDFDERNMPPLPPIPEFNDNDVPPDPNNVDQAEKATSNKDVKQPIKNAQNDIEQVSEPSSKQVPENAVSDFDERNMSPLPPIPEFNDNDVPPDPNNVDQAENTPVTKPKTVTDKKRKYNKKQKTQSKVAPRELDKGMPESEAQLYARNAVFGQPVAKLVKCVEKQPNSPFVNVTYRALEDEQQLINDHYKDKLNNLNDTDYIFNSGTYDVSQETGQAMPDVLYQPFDKHHDLNVSYGSFDGKLTKNNTKTDFMKMPYVSKNATLNVNKDVNGISKDIDDVGIHDSQVVIPKNITVNKTQIKKSNTVLNNNVSESKLNHVDGDLNKTTRSIIENAVISNSSFNKSYVKATQKAPHILTNTTVDSSIIDAPNNNPSVINNSKVKNSEIIETQMSESTFEDSRIKSQLPESKKQNGFSAIMDGVHVENSSLLAKNNQINLDKTYFKDNLPVQIKDAPDLTKPDCDEDLFSY